VIILSGEGKTGRDVKEIIFSQHVKDQMVDRGTSEDEIRIAIRDGEKISAKRGREAYLKNFPFESYWKEKYYTTKQVVPIVMEETNEIVVVTVYVYYFGGRK
jgi:hypothetical protein